MIHDKKILAGYKRKFDLHVLLLQEKHGLNRSAAMVQAYAAGPRFADELLAQGSLPISDAPKPKAP